MILNQSFPLMYIALHHSQNIRPPRMMYNQSRTPICVITILVQIHIRKHSSWITAQERDDVNLCTADVCSISPNRVLCTGFQMPNAHTPISLYCSQSISLSYSIFLYIGTTTINLQLILFLDKYIHYCYTLIISSNFCGKHLLKLFGIRYWGIGGMGDSIPSYIGSW